VKQGVSLEDKVGSWIRQALRNVSLLFTPQNKNFRHLIISKHLIFGSERDHSGIKNLWLSKLQNSNVEKQIFKILTLFTTDTMLITCETPRPLLELGTCFRLGHTTRLLAYHVNNSKIVKLFILVTVVTMVYLQQLFFSLGNSSVFGHQSAQPVDTTSQISTSAIL
jgi:hypothetical protein